LAIFLFAKPGIFDIIHFLCGGFMIERYSLPKMSAIWDDEFKFQTMLEIEILALEAFARLGKVPKAVAVRVRKKARFNLAEIKKIEEKTQHDIVAFVTCVAQYIGPDAKYLHAGLTSSDLLDTTLGVQLGRASDILIGDLKRLLGILVKKAIKYKDMACIGRTHGVHAEPTTLGLKLALWYDETRRNLERLRQAKEAVCLGKISGAVGTYSNIEPAVESYICKKLGLRPANIATQVISRDVYAHYMAALAVIGASLEKFALEIRHLQRTEVREVEEPFGKGQKGSSAMPHKRNPVICERICGLARLLRGNALCAFENVALWHERDLTNSSAERILIPESCILTDYILNLMVNLLSNLVFKFDNIERNLMMSETIMAESIMINLVEKGMGRQAAHELVRECAMESYGSDKTFKEVLTDNVQVREYLSKGEIWDAINPKKYIGTAVEQVENVIGKLS